jgi:hypothetical protein
MQVTNELDQEFRFEQIELNEEVEELIRNLEKVEII